MFEHMTITRQGAAGAPIDLGSLAECLLFYEKVRVVSDLETFKFLVRCCGADELLDLFDIGVLEIEYFENITGVMTVQTNHGELHELKTIQADKLRYQRASRTFFDEWVGPSGKGANKLFRQFDKRVLRSTYTIPILEQAHSDFLDTPCIKESIHAILALLAPEYLIPNPLKFEIKTVLGGRSYLLDTNIDFAAADASFQQHVPVGFGHLTPAFLLGQLLETRRDIVVGSRMDSDFALSPIRSAAAACKFSELILASQKGIAAADAFQEMAIDDLPRIRDVVNSGERPFTDVVRLVERATKFKGWLKRQGSSEAVLKDYLHEISHIDWADKLPPRILRMLLMTGAGIGLSTVTTPLAGAFGALALNSADYFLIDKLIKGWRPSQFVEGPLKQFLSDKPKE